MLTCEAGNAFLRKFLKKELSKCLGELNRNCFWCCRVSITADDPQWVGAWWIGFLFSGLPDFLLSIPLCGFPKTLPGERHGLLELRKTCNAELLYKLKNCYVVAGVGKLCQNIWKYVISVVLLVFVETEGILELAAR